MSSFLQDVRIAVRGYLAQPLFTIVVLSILGLAIGANSAIFYADAIGQPRFRAWLLGLFAATAILLAMTGLYGTMAYAVQQRTREIGLRIALGATPQQATAPLLRTGLTLILLGTLLGLAGSVGVARALSSMLFGVGAVDPAAFIGAAAMLAVVASLACYVPARHARHLDPRKAINAE